jgi:hypothetical protein
VVINLRRQEEKMSARKSIDVGVDATDRSFLQNAGSTILSLDNPANADGTIDFIAVFAKQNITDLVVGTFFLANGTNYQCRDSESIGDIASGQMFTCSGLDIAVKAGDVIGAWWASGFLAIDASGYAGCMYADGKHIDQGDQASYSLKAGAAISLYGTG